MITRALLRYPGFDTWFEDSRAEYIAELANAAGCTTSAIDLVVRALPRAKQLGNAEHRLYLARHFASNGHPSAKEAVYEAFHRSHEADPFFAATIITRLDGIDGLVYVIRKLGPRLTQENITELWMLNDAAVEASSADEVHARLSGLAETEPEVGTFLSIQQQWNERKQRRTRKWPPMSFIQFRARVTKLKGKIVMAVGAACGTGCKQQRMRSSLKWHELLSSSKMATG